MSFVLASREGRLPELVHWGARLPDDEDLAALTDVARVPPGGGVLDAAGEASVCPDRAEGLDAEPGLALSGADGAPLAPRFRFESAREAPGRLALRFADPALGLTYALDARLPAGAEVIRLRARVEGPPTRCLWLTAPALALPPGIVEAVTFEGRWCGEFQPTRRAIAPGRIEQSSRLGRTSHERFPGLLLCGPGTTETRGEALGAHLEWSGGHRLVVERLPDGRRLVQLGLMPGDAPRAAHESGWLVLARSDAGFNGVSARFHDYLRREVLRFPDPSRPRPVHCNCWEAVYFDHDPDVLGDLARRAADLGAERFVLDDGWFGRRDDDASSLGDWEVDRRKWPDGLTPFIDHVKALGMTFGLWVEPEMVSPDSDLHRAHPDWTLGPADQPTGRGQLVLDIARPEVADHLFARLDAILSAHDIDYLKWDHNRVLPFPDPAQTEALYALLDRLRAAHPGVEIETCASGGGRADFGILRRTHRIWLSDSNDAHERWAIQRGASYFFPPEISGAHAGPRVCHTSGRVLSAAFRAGVAGTRATGLEMDLRELTGDEAETFRAAIAAFKRRRALLHSGRLLRLDHDDPAVSAEMHLARDGGGFLVFAARLAASAERSTRPLRLAGLDPAARYRVRLEAPETAPPVLNRGPRTPFARGEPVVLSGAALMGAGLRLPDSFPDSLWTVEGTRA